MLIFQNLPKFEEKGTLPNLSYNASCIILKPDKKLLHEKKIRPISLVNTDAKNPQGATSPPIQQHIKWTKHHDQDGFIPKVKISSTYANQFVVFSLSAL